MADFRDLSLRSIRSVVERLLAEIHHREFSSVSSASSHARGTLEREVELVFGCGTVLERSCPRQQLRRLLASMCCASFSAPGILRTLAALQGRRISAAWVLVLACTAPQRLEHGTVRRRNHQGDLSLPLCSRYRRACIGQGHKSRIRWPPPAACRTSTCTVRFSGWPNSPGRLGVHVDGKWHLTFDWMKGEGAFGIRLERR